MTEPTPCRFTTYFLTMRERPDRAGITIEWIQQTAGAPEYRHVQADGRLPTGGAFPKRETVDCG